jgi:hypothetical protein
MSTLKIIIKTVITIYNTSYLKVVVAIFHASMVAVDENVKKILIKTVITLQVTSK